MKKTLLGLGIVCAALLVPMLVTGNDTVTICHASTNHYVQIVTSSNAISGHFENNGTPKAGHEDDLLLQGDVTCPPFPGTTPTPSGSVIPTPSTSSTPSSSVTPTPSESATPTPSNSVTPTPSRTPTPTPHRGSSSSSSGCFQGLQPDGTHYPCYYFNHTQPSPSTFIPTPTPTPNISEVAKVKTGVNSLTLALIIAFLSTPIIYGILYRKELINHSL